MSIYLKMAAFAALIGLIVWWDVSTWRECRAHGFSKFYCFRQSGR